MFLALFGRQPHASIVTIAGGDAVDVDFWIIVQQIEKLPTCLSHPDERGFGELNALALPAHPEVVGEREVSTRSKTNGHPTSLGGGNLQEAGAACPYFGMIEGVASYCIRIGSSRTPFRDRLLAHLD